MSKFRITGSSDKTIFWLIAGFSIFAIILIGFVAIRESKEAQGSINVQPYSVSDTDKPKARVNENNKNLGKMSVNDEKTAEFTIENTGDKPLQLFKVTSSCGCTLGTISINGQKSPEFSMHSKSNWTGTLAPSEKATVEITYKPSIMPVKGSVTRSVYVSTNDPDNKELTFSVKAYVE